MTVGVNLPLARSIVRIAHNAFDCCGPSRRTNIPSPPFSFLNTAMRDSGLVQCRCHKFCQFAAGRMAVRWKVCLKANEGSQCHGKQSASFGGGDAWLLTLAF